MKILTLLIFAALLSSCALTPTQKVQLRSTGKTIVKIIDAVAIQLTRAELEQLAAQGLK